MEELFSKFKNFILPAFILIQLLIVGLKKLLDKKKEKGKRKKWEEYTKRLGFTLKETSDTKQPYIALRISNHNSYLIDWPLPGGIKEGLALISTIDNTRTDKNFIIKKKFKFRSKKSTFGNISQGMLNIEDDYDISYDNENFKRKLLNSRVITHILSTQPESLSFFDMEDARTMFIPEKIENNLLLLVVFNMPGDYNKVNEFIELCRIVINSLDAI